MLAPVSAKALERIESIIERLAKGEEEAISHAMSTCRRLIDSFADAVYPAQSEPVLVDGQPVEANKSKVLNRIDLYVRQYTTSKSRQQRLRQLLRGIYDRVSTAVHNDVTPAEARFLFLETYVALGEILALAPKPEMASTAVKTVPEE
jgi:predicted NBD/HSP70 family sugar kinase